MKNGYIGFDFSSTRIRYTIVQPKGKGFEVQASGSQPLKLNVAAQGELTQVVRNILKQEGVQPKRVFLTLSRQDTLIRFMKYGRMSQRELEEIVNAEIEKIPAFLNNKFDFVFQKFPGDRKDKMGVVFAAIQQKFLSYIIKEVQKVGVPVDHLEVAPLNLQEMLYLQQPQDKPQVMLIVNDVLTYFIIYKDHRFHLLYKTSIGTNSLYSEINQSINQRTFDSLISELQRVMKSYQDIKTSDKPQVEKGPHPQNDEQTFKHLTLIWDDEKGTDFVDHIKNGLNMDVHVPNVNALGDSSTPERVINPINLLSCVPIFYHCNRLKSQFSLNHFFRAYQAKAYGIRSAFVGAAIIGCAALFSVPMSLHLLHQKSGFKNKTIQVNNEIRSLKQRSEDLFQQRDEYNAIRDGLLGQAAYVRALNRISWSQVLDVISEDMPNGLGLTSFRFNEGGGVVFKGEAVSMETISELIRRVDDSEILHNSSFDFLREYQLEDQKVFQFGIMASLRPQSPEEQVDGETTDTMEKNAGIEKADLANANLGDRQL